MNSRINSQPKVSVITPSYNSEKFISKTINSVLQQTYQNWEMIIVDDASSDETVSLINEYKEKDRRIRVVPLEENKGAANARNIGIRESTGRFIAFLDSDDEWMPEKIEKQLSFMLKKNIGFSHTAYSIVDETGQWIKASEKVPPSTNYKDLLKQNTIGCLTVMLDKEKVGEVEMVDIRARQDYVLWLEITKKGQLAYGLNESLAKYRQMSSSLSSNKLNMVKLNWKVYRDIEKLSLLKSIWYFAHFAINKTMKYMK
ncbi:glycosyltransferase family 2 protein [Salipaludibacillus daqingensis]|uniref:glycosyltransferase family 2 protein n=1 Tax=Salipaludibacillus daqingensis TaxID=3041001 RepID=UPI00247355FF|nr:glycosyltransferase family 2 protein [Salipaludibacillus daqingensis]